MGRLKVKPNEVLFTEGAWSIERGWKKPGASVRPHWWHDNAKSFLVHVCPGERAVKGVYCWPDDGGNKCWRCDAVVPDGIKGMWVLHNWEEIQSEAG